MINFRFGRLNLVDLAGSERYVTFHYLLWFKFLLRDYAYWDWDSLIGVHNDLWSRQKASGAEGERLKEAASINKSLSTLGYAQT